MIAAQPKINTFPCSANEIAAYIDGELDSLRELELEAHFAGCEICALELNQQKQFLSSLYLSLKHEKEFELPANFTRSIVANAESKVSGLRRPRERFNALFICVALSLFVLFALGPDVGNLFGRMAVVLDQIAAVAGFFGHIIYSFFVGAGVVLRTLGGQVPFPAAFSFVLFGVFAAIFLVFSRMLIRFRRT